MAKKIIWYDKDRAGQLHCDSCHYDMPERTVWGPHLLGTPCPKCGADMLTRSDFDKVERMWAWLDWLNKWFGWLGSETQPAGPEVLIHIHDDTLTIKKHPKR
jgi:predicted RNA-binding Zn-ribbon protein involved in translation (DUF1610 family)